MEHGADVNARLKRGASGRGVLSRTGATPFLLAAMTADVPLMRTLVKLGADPLLPNAEHCTPLMAAAGVGCLAPGEEAGTEDEALEAVKLALELGNDVNAVDDNGETAMHGAAYKSLPKVVQLLADKGAKIEVWNRKNKYGWTPLSIAEGHRPGNFKPSPETIAALHRVMLAAGVSPPPGTTPIEDRKGPRLDPFAEQEPANELLVVPRCTHQHGGRPARKSDLERRFEGDIVHALAAGVAFGQDLDRIRDRFVVS